MHLELYGYYRSSAAYRVRIALNLKGLDYTRTSIHLRHREQQGEAYRAINPQALVPTLRIGDDRLSQSLAIIEYLEETWPAPGLLPTAPLDRARVRQMALLIACDIHPLNNFSVLVALKALGIDEDARNGWYRANVERGFAALEQLVNEYSPGTAFCFGDSPSLADICLVPQMYNARRFDCDLSACPRLVAIDQHCLTLPAFDSAAPENQPDAE